MESRALGAAITFSYMAFGPVSILDTTCLQEAGWLEGAGVDFGFISCGLPETHPCPGRVYIEGCNVRGGNSGVRVPGDV